MKDEIPEKKTKLEQNYKQKYFRQRTDSSSDTQSSDSELSEENDELMKSFSTILEKSQKKEEKKIKKELLENRRKSMRERYERKFQHDEDLNSVSPPAEMEDDGTPFQRQRVLRSDPTPVKVKELEKWKSFESIKKIQKKKK
jgi:hypothetical protein